MSNQHSVTGNAGSTVYHAQDQKKCDCMVLGVESMGKQGAETPDRRVSPALKTIGPALEAQSDPASFRQGQSRGHIKHGETRGDTRRTCDNARSTR